MEREREQGDRVEQVVADAGLEGGEVLGHDLRAQRVRAARADRDARRADQRRHREPASAHSGSPDTAATSARSRSFTEATSNLRADAAMRVSAAGSSIGGFVSPFFGLWKRTGLMRATT